MRPSGTNLERRHGRVLRVPLPVPAICLLAAATLAAAAATGPAAAAGPTKLAIYSAPANETFVANADDEARGSANNPYGTHTHSASVSEKNNGPFAGDEALFSFDVYSSPSLATKIGSAVYTCQYYFNKNAFCDASFQLKGGTLIAAGALNFTAKTFALAVTGGYGTYAGATGDVEASPSGKGAQRLVFVLG